MTGPLSMGIVVCTVGLPRSGKTTWAREQGSPIVNPDSIRLAMHGQRYAKEAEPYVWAVAKTMVVALLLSGHETVIVDATNNTRKRRDMWQDPRWDTRFVLIDTTKEECLKRAREYGDEEIVPVIERMAEQKEPLALDELEWK